MGISYNVEALADKYTPFLLHFFVENYKKCITFFHRIFPRNSVHRIQFELIHWKLLKWNYAIVLRFDEFVNLFFFLQILL